MSLLSVQTYDQHETVRLTLTGELDLSSALSFEEALLRIETDRSPRTIVIDLSRLKFMDSTGLRLILSAHARALKRGRRLVIVQGGAAVRRIFRLTGVEDRLDIVEATPAAV